MSSSSEASRLYLNKSTLRLGYAFPNQFSLDAFLSSNNRASYKCISSQKYRMLDNLNEQSEAIFLSIDCLLFNQRGEELKVLKSDVISIKEIPLISLNEYFKRQAQYFECEYGIVGSNFGIIFKDLTVGNIYLFGRYKTQYQIKRIQNIPEGEALTFVEISQLRKGELKYEIVDRTNFHSVFILDVYKYCSASVVTNNSSSCTITPGDNQDLAARLHGKSVTIINAEGQLPTSPVNQSHSLLSNSAQSDYTTSLSLKQPNQPMAVLLQRSVETTDKVQLLYNTLSSQANIKSSASPFETDQLRMNIDAKNSHLEQDENVMNASNNRNNEEDVPLAAKGFSPLTTSESSIATKKRVTFHEQANGITRNIGCGSNIESPDEANDIYKRSKLSEMPSFIISEVKVERSQ